ncbi:MAG TPA: hypothetical protein ENN41_08755 [Sediminispirochaeta sp.]|nr:hypothetical protein [Sediminispirochaeta sp.]
MPRAHSIDLEKVRKFLREKEERRRGELHLRWEKARGDFEAIVSRILESHKPRRIYQWGSLLDFSRFSDISDIDIALEGLAGPQEYFDILGEAMEMTSFPLDIIEMEKLDPTTAEEIRRKGRLVYERRSQ